MIGFFLVGTINPPTFVLFPLEIFLSFVLVVFAVRTYLVVSVYSCTGLAAHSGGKHSLFQSSL